MKKETFRVLDEAIISLATNTNIVQSDITSLIRLYDEARKQLIKKSLVTMKEKISILETEVDLINANNNSIEAQV